MIIIYTVYLLYHIILISFQFDQFTIIALHSAFSADALKSSHPIYIPVSTLNEFYEIFDSIAYDKVRIIWINLQVVV